MNSYFSVNQANEILPTVIKKFDYAKKMKVEVMKMEQQVNFWPYTYNFFRRIYYYQKET